MKISLFNSWRYLLAEFFLKTLLILFCFHFFSLFSTFEQKKMPWKIINTLSILKKKWSRNWLYLSQELPKIFDSMVDLNGQCPYNGNFIGGPESVIIGGRRCIVHVAACVTAWNPTRTRTTTTRKRVTDGHGRSFGSWPWKIFKKKIFSFIKSTYLNNLRFFTKKLNTHLLKISNFGRHVLLSMLVRKTQFHKRNWK